MASIRINHLRSVRRHRIHVIMWMLKVMWHVVMVLGQNPFVHGRFLTRQTGGGALGIFLWRRIRIMVEMVV